MYSWITLHKSGTSLCEYTNNICDSCQIRRPLDVDPRCRHEDQIRFMIDEFVSIETYRFWYTFHDENVSYSASKKKKKCKRWWSEAPLNRKKTNRLEFGI